MNFFNFFNKEPRTRLGLSPDKVFVEKTKGRFLAAFDAHYGTRAAHGYSAMAKVFATALAAIAIVASATVYAETSNVAPDSSFYPLKRLGESVQLQFTPAAKKSQLQASFAVRRMDEISDLQLRKPSSTVLPALNNDLDAAVSASISDQVSIDLPRGKPSDFCANLFSAIGSNDSLVHDGLLRHPQIIQRFEQRCGQAVPAASMESSSSINILLNATSSSEGNGGSLPGKGLNSSSRIGTGSVKINIEGNDH